MYDYSVCPNRVILCVDLVSFYASVSSIKMGYDPLRTKLAVVGDINRPGSVVLAATPPLKKLGETMGKKFNRLYEIPKRPDIIIVNPMMETYIKCSNYITKLALQYVAPCDFFQMSIDEFFLEMDSSLHLFANDPNEFAYKLQQEIYQKTRITCAIGISVSPLMSKLCLDLVAKKHPDRIANWTYSDVQTKLWLIRPLSKFYGISSKTEQKLNRKGIYTIGDLAEYPLKYLKQTFGPVIGEELHLHSWGIDFSRIREKHIPKSASIGKNQVLLRDYYIEEIPFILLDEIRTRFGKNSILRAVSYTPGATSKYRNSLLGGHRA